MSRENRFKQNVRHSREPVRLTEVETKRMPAANAFRSRWIDSSACRLTGEAATPGMRICLNLDSSRLLRWHVWLTKALAEVPGNEISRAIAPERRPLPVGSRLLFELERMVYGFRGNGAVD